MSYNKKQLSNQKRLIALKQWTKNKSNQDGFIQKSFQELDYKNNSHNRKIIYAHESSTNDLLPTNKNHSLFESTSSDSEDDINFKIRPQFDGSSGQELLEMNSNFSGRFKLDERFKDNDFPENNEDTSKNEKKRNFQILEEVLGHSVPTSENFNQKIVNKCHRRFDPEDEKALKYIKTNDEVKEESKKKKKKKKNDVSPSKDIPISKERYTEINTSFKTILNSSEKNFSFSHQFNSFQEENFDDNKDMQNEPKMFENSNNDEINNDLDNEKIKESKFTNKKNEKTKRSSEIIFESRVFKQDNFFFSGDDPRLKEGIEFFKRSKPIELIRKEWPKKKETLLELFRKKRKYLSRKEKAERKCNQNAFKKKMMIKKMKANFRNKQRK